MRFQLRRSWLLNLSQEGKSRPSNLNQEAKSKSNFGIRDYWCGRELAPLLRACGIRDSLNDLQFEQRFPTGLRGNPPDPDLRSEAVTRPSRESPTRLGDTLEVAAQAAHAPHTARLSEPVDGPLPAAAGESAHALVQRCWAQPSSASLPCLRGEMATAASPHRGLPGARQGGIAQLFHLSQPHWCKVRTTNMSI